LLRVEIARTIADVEQLRRIWSRWKTHHDSDIDYCLEYVWKLDSFIRPHVLMLYESDTPVSLLVARIERGRIGAKIGYTKVPFDGGKILYVSYLGFLGEATHRTAVVAVEALVRSLARGDADAAVFYEGEESVVNLAIKNLNPAQGSYRAAPLQAHSLMSLTGGLDAIHARLSSGLRSELRRKTKKFASTYGREVSVRSFNTLSALEPMLPQIEHIASHSYQRRLGVGFEDTSEQRRRLQVCGDHGWLRVFTLNVGEKVCAYWIGTHYGDRFCSDYLSFDAEYQSYSPGTVLFAHMLEILAFEGLQSVDFGAGGSRYKERFGDTPVSEQFVRVFASNASGVYLRSLYSSSFWVDHHLRGILGKREMLSRVKNLWRRDRSKADSKPAAPNA
jgi:Acetyltransferase (GNAT) domain